MTLRAKSVSTPLEAQQTALDSRPHHGDLDMKEFTVDSTIWLPVFGLGGLLAAAHNYRHGVGLREV
jgi:acetamidase/formamidase